MVVTGGALVALTGTFLTWVRSGSAGRTSYEVFGLAELSELLSRCGGLPPDAVADRVEAAVLAASEGRLRDDMAILALGPTPADATIFPARAPATEE